MLGLGSWIEKRSKVHFEGIFNGGLIPSIEDIFISNIIRRIEQSNQRKLRKSIFEITLNLDWLCF